MSAVKILHCADLHIGASVSFLGEKSSSRQMETLLTFERICDTASKENVKIVLISGDLFDSNKIPESFFERVISKMAEKSDIYFVISLGNHDPLNFSSPFWNAKMPENIKLFSDKDGVFPIGDNVDVYGRSFCEVLEKGEDKFSLNPDPEKINIMCIHGEYGLGGMQNPITDDFIINSGMDYIALGHVHQKSTPKKIGNTYIAYSGCPEGLGFDELGEKGVYIGEIDKNYCNISFVKTAKRMHIEEKIDVTSCENSPEIYEKIIETLIGKYGESYTENLYKIILCGEIKEDTEINLTEIKERLKEKVYFVKIKDKTGIKFNLDALKNEVSLKGIFVSNMLKKAEENPEIKEEIEEALKIGLKAFSGEVEIYED